MRYHIMKREWRGIWNWYVFITTPCQFDQYRFDTFEQARQFVFRRA